MVWMSLQSRRAPSAPSMQTSSCFVFQTTMTAQQILFVQSLANSFIVFATSPTMVATENQIVDASSGPSTHAKNTRKERMAKVPSVKIPRQRSKKSMKLQLCMRRILSMVNH